jgi:hypothetical protein
MEDAADNAALSTLGREGACLLFLLKIFLVELSSMVRYMSQVLTSPTDVPKCGEDLCAGRRCAPSGVDILRSRQEHISAISATGITPPAY